MRDMIFCGTHARVRNPRIWKDVNNVDDKAVLIQKLWRGYSIRSWLNLAGRGVLNRSVCHNEEEIVTFDDKKSVYPLDYFAFEEANKVYWFDIRSMIQNSINKLHPVNPYTREPLSIDTRKRLRKLSIKRIYCGLRNIHTDLSPLSADELINVIWVNVCQIIEENGFFDVSPVYFTCLNRSQIYVFLQLVYKDLVAWAAEHTSRYSRRKRYPGWIQDIKSEYTRGESDRMLNYMTAKCVLSLLNDAIDPYPLCFIVMSALHRL
jgi:hypothetical protein